MPKDADDRSRSRRWIGGRAVTLLDGVRAFDAGSFFEAHEAWEALWLAEKDEAKRRCLQGLIQIAAGFHKLVAKNAPESAARLLARGLAKIDAAPVEPALEIEGVDLGAFREAVRVCASELEAGHPERVVAPKLGRALTEGAARTSRAGPSSDH